MADTRSPLQSKTEVLIVGAGAAGSWLARRLAMAGRSVRVLEAGPGWKLDDLASSQIWARRLRWGGPLVETTGRNPFGYGFNAGWGLGGAALHHYGTWLRFDPHDFAMKTRFGRGRDWPFGYETLRPFYDRVQRDVGISGDAGAEVWRPPGDPYPLPALSPTSQGESIARGFRALGEHVAPMPMAILSREYRGRAACLYDGWCDAGCPIGALYNPLVRDIPEARSAGAEFVTGAQVTSLLWDKGAGRIAGALWRERDGGVLHRAEADLVILAASAVHNPALLLNSVSSRWPRGIGNEHDLVGRFFMTHAVLGIYGLMVEETFPHLGVSGAQFSARDDYAKARGDDEAAFGSYHWLIAPAAKPDDLLGIAISRPDVWGAALDPFMKRAARHFASMIAMVEDLPQARNRVMLAEPPRPDSPPSVRIEHAFAPETLAVWSRAKRRGLAVFRAAGANEPWSSGVNTAHMMGGTIIGRDPRDSVANEWGRVHGIPNLFIAGTGLYPAAGALNPTFTLYALAERTAEYLINHWRDHVPSG
ncbi:MAG: GMC family oxidoreductase [Alphaproteobacteria bacterium]|nr:MAG: GMC family oxidoreductase [Alphaproteobacteria bacterium]